MRRLLAVVLWSVIAAAFIGPGTVTTSGAAGSPSSFSTIPIEPRPAWRTKGGGGTAMDDTRAAV